jgi:hypothetical protein
MSLQAIRACAGSGGQQVSAPNGASRPSAATYARCCAPSAMSLL